MKIALVLVIVGVCVDLSISASSTLRLCHEIECPHEAVSCTKSFKSSADNKKLITSYICDGADGAALATKSVEETNRQYATKVHQPYSITKPFLVI